MAFFRFPPFLRSRGALTLTLIVLLVSIVNAVAVFADADVAFFTGLLSVVALSVYVLLLRWKRNDMTWERDDVWRREWERR